MEDGLTTVADLANDLRVDPKSLRQAIRDHRLVPDHQRGKHYRLDAEDLRRIKTHPAVKMLPRM